VTRALPPLLTLCAVLLAWLGWLLGGMLADRVGLDDLELPAHAAGVFVLAALAQAAQSRWVERNPHG
jgi:hypothetical protein